MFRQAELISIHESMDPPCNWSQMHRSMHICSGSCPLAYAKRRTCLFLPRVIHPDFEKLGMYCKPPEDKCPYYNAWLKDKLPLTQKPISRIPDSVWTNFTLDGLIEVEYGAGPMFRNSSGQELTWSVEFLESYREKVRTRQPFGSYNSDALYPVFDEYSKLTVLGKNCAVIGSEFPWVEAALLENGASSVTTIEYIPIKIIGVPRLTAVTPEQFITKRFNKDSYHTELLFDSIWSYSSLEHDGLGRYMDPINPYGDFLTMTKISCMLKPGGILFLAVPSNYHDTIRFNLHRVYGPIRYPILYRYFHLVRVFGGKIPHLKGEYTQPILVLQNKVGCL